jgi:hypothetical protein
MYLVRAGYFRTTLPAVMFGVSRSTVRRRFTRWADSELWMRPPERLLYRLG